MYRASRLQVSLIFNHPPNISMLVGQLNGEPP